MTDDAVRATPELPRPGYLEPFVDPVFGQRVVRVTGDPGTPIPGIGDTWPDIARHHYSSNPAWNADMSLLYLRFADLFLDGRTYQPLFRAKSPARYRQWHPTDPDLFVFTRDRQLGTWNVRTGEIDVLREFPEYAAVSIGRRSGLSNYGRRIAIQATKTDGENVIFAYDVVSGQKFPEINLDKGDWELEGGKISALGNYIGLRRKGRVVGVFDVQGRSIGTHDVLKHIDYAVEENGDEVVVGIRAGKVVKVRLKDLKVTELTDRGYGNHVSTRNIDRPDWAIVSYDSGRERHAPYLLEIAMVKLDGSGEVRRLAHSHAERTQYRAETHASPSPDGSRIIFASTWGNTDGSIGAYVIELCGSHN